MGKLGIATLTFWLALQGCAKPAANPAEKLFGAYRTGSGKLAIIGPSAEKGTLRLYDASNGMSRRLYPVVGAGEDCTARGPAARYQTGDGWAVKEPAVMFADFQIAEGSEPKLRLQAAGQPPVEGTHVPLHTEVLEFENQGLRLVGRLYLPAGAGPHPAIVLHQGSERDSWMDFNSEGYLFAANGVAAFCVDKRGVGRSQGRFTMDFHKLAGDMAAAVGRVKVHRAIDPARIGTGGYSQGGWIAPLAASLRDDVRFVMVAFGLLDSPFAEDREETLNGLRDGGFKEADLAKARKVIEAVHEVVRQDLKGGWEGLRGVKSEFWGEPWMKHMDGGMTGPFLKWPAWCLRLLAKRQMPPEVPWDYDPRHTLEKLNVPMLWLVGAEDREAPPEETLARLDAFKRQGKPFEVALFPGADHGIVLFRVEKGQRVITGYHPDYARTKSEWVARMAGVIAAE